MDKLTFPKDNNINSEKLEISSLKTKVPQVNRPTIIKPNSKSKEGK